MFKKTIFASAILVLGVSTAFAAGGEINAKISQESTMKNSKVIGADDAKVKLEKLPLLGKALEGKLEGKMTINTIDNQGKINGAVTQTNEMDRSTAISSQINTLMNTKRATIGDDATISQESTMSDGSVVVGAKVNTINNH